MIQWSGLADIKSWHGAKLYIYVITKIKLMSLNINEKVQLSKQNLENHVHGYLKYDFYLIKSISKMPLEKVYPLQTVNASWCISCSWKQRETLSIYLCMSVWKINPVSAVTKIISFICQVISHKYHLLFMD